MGTEQWTVGDIRITKIEEVDGWAPLEVSERVLSGLTVAELEKIEWLTPAYVNDGKANVLVHSLLVETPTHRVVVDTGIGNGKPRLSPFFDHLETDFLERFSQVWARGDVDLVLSTHLHVDHVGWNTIFEDGRWKPTFPSARYCFVPEEYAHWKAFADDPSARDAYSEWGYSMVDAAAVFEDSLKPVADAGLVEWVSPGDSIAPGITLIGTQGHTPGHVSVLLESGGEAAVITGDLFHSQAQIARPEWTAAMDTDSAAAALARREFIERFADTGTLILGTHFGTPTGGHIVRDGADFQLVPVWV